MEAGVRIGDVYALLVGEQCCLWFAHLSLDRCQHAKASVPCAVSPYIPENAYSRTSGLAKISSLLMSFEFADFGSVHLYCISAVLSTACSCISRRHVT